MREFNLRPQRGWHADGPASRPAMARPERQGILDVQRSAGNRAAAAAVQRMPDEAGTTAPAESPAPAKGETAYDHYQRGEAAYLKANYGEAFDQWTLANQLQPLPELRFNMAQALKRMGGHREEVIQLLSGYLLAGGERVQQAEETIRELGGEVPGEGDGDAATVTPGGDAEKHFRIGEEAYAKGEYGRAYDQWELTYSLQAIPEVRYNMAQCLRRMGGRREEAIQLYRGYLLAGGARVQQAEAAILELGGTVPAEDGKSDDRSAEQAFRVGEQAFARGDVGRAYDQFEIACTRQPLPEIAFSMAQCLRRMGGRRDEAIALYREYLSSGGTDRAKDAREFIAQLGGTVEGTA